MELKAGAVVHIAFCSAIGSPRDFGSPDLRRLGIGLVRIAFRQREKQAAA